MPLWHIPAQLFAKIFRLTPVCLLACAILHSPKPNPAARTA